MVRFKSEDEMSPDTLALLKLLEGDDEFEHLDCTDNSSGAPPEKRCRVHR